MKLFLFGASGKMGRAVREAAAHKGVTVTGGFDEHAADGLPVYNAVGKVPGDFDIIVDFSRPTLLNDVIRLSDMYGKNVVIATTGYSETQREQIKALSKRVAVLQSGNMSLGVNLLLSLVEQATKVLAGYDVEIIEKHHNQKVDAPSGTADMLANAVRTVRRDAHTVFGREGESLRQSGEIGMHSVRGGTIVGEHDVIFAGADEIVTLSHTALSRKIFANGAIVAAEFLMQRAPGMYSMKDAIAMHGSV